MKNRMYKYILIILSVALFSCEEKVGDSLDFSGDTSIHSFSVNGVDGTINEENSTISVILPSGSDLTGLSPEITIAEGAEITPGTGESVDFVNAEGKLLDVVYTVTNSDLYQKYTVSVDVVRAKITSFKINSVEGTIDDQNKTIVLYLPEGTDVTSLSPVVEYTEGATLTPEAGSPVDFTNPVTYSLDYLGSVFNYTVTVNLGEAVTPVLVLYNGEDVSPTWESVGDISVNNGYANPVTDGINSSSTCVMVTRDPSQEPWFGGALWNANQVNVDPAIYGTITVMILKDVAGDVQLEVQSADGVKDWLHADYSADHLGEWQKLTFVIPESRTAMINNILVMPHLVKDGFVTQEMYWDEVKAHPKGTVLYNGEDVSPTWESVGDISVNNGYANPVTDGINSTSTCVMVTRDPSQEAWFGGALWGANQVEVDPAEYSKITLMLLKNVAGDVQLEVQSADGVKDWLHADYSADHLGEWQELTFVIPESRTAMINNILVMPHLVKDGFVTQEMYWDEVKAYPKE